MRKVGRAGEKEERKERGRGGREEGLWTGEGGRVSKVGLSYGHR